MSAYRTSYDAKHLRKVQEQTTPLSKRVATAVLAQPVCSSDLREDECYKGKQKLTFKTCTGSWTLHYLEGDVWPPQTWRLLHVLTECSSDPNPCHPSKEQDHHTRSELPVSWWDKKLCMPCFSKSSDWRIYFNLCEVLYTKVVCPHTQHSSVGSKYFSQPIHPHAE